MLILVPRTGINVNTNTREVARQSLCSNPDSIWQGRYLIQFGRVLLDVSVCKMLGATEIRGKGLLTFCSTIVARLRRAIELVAGVGAFVHNGKRRLTARDDGVLIILDA